MEPLYPYVGADTLETAGRLGVAMLLGVILGIDREINRKPAGLRSHMLVSLAAASFTIVAFAIIDVAEDFGDAVRVDPLRLMEAVVAGVAFLGAGAIIRGGGSVQGITTGASLWLAGALGVACGVGFYGIAILTAVFGFVVLALIGWIERRVEQTAARLDDDRQ